MGHQDTVFHMEYCFGFQFDLILSTQAPPDAGNLLINLLSLQLCKRQGSQQELGAFLDRNARFWPSSA